MSKIISTGLFSTPWPFWTGISSQVSKNVDEKTLLLRVVWLYNDTVKLYLCKSSYLSNGF